MPVMVTDIPVRPLSGKKAKSNYLLNYSSYYNVEGNLMVGFWAVNRE